mgnify:FL=1
MKDFRAEDIARIVRSLDTGELLLSFELISLDVRRDPSSDVRARIVTGAGASAMFTAFYERELDAALSFRLIGVPTPAYDAW